MQTDELIQSLTHDLKPAPADLVPRLLNWAAVVGLSIAVLIIAVVGVRKDLSTALFSWPFWMKWTYAISMALTAYLLCERMARPGAKLGWLAILPLLPFAMLSFMAIRTQWHLPSDARMATWLGHSATLCPFYIGALSIPVFAVLCRTLRRAAPTNLRVAACAAGLMSGAMAAFAYGLLCTESSVSFVTTWYTLGMLVPAAIGAVFGNTLLRWS
jgi:hypothetical protein